MAKRPFGYGDPLRMSTHVQASHYLPRNKAQLHKLKFHLEIFGKPVQHSEQYLLGRRFSDRHQVSGDRCFRHGVDTHSRLTKKAS